MRIHKGDTAQVMVGKDAGKSGKIIRVYPEDNKVLLENLNLYKKHRRPRQQGQKGEIIMVARPLPAGNIRLFCKNCGRPARVGCRMEGGRKIRYCKKCKTAI